LVQNQSSVFKFRKQIDLSEQFLKIRTATYPHDLIELIKKTKSKKNEYLLDITAGLIWNVEKSAKNETSDFLRNVSRENIHPTHQHGADKLC
jgi:thermostable 8-oxoguanine DNA glycosylase